jgi:hypothetical protein
LNYFQFPYFSQDQDQYRQLNQWIDPNYLDYPYGAPEYMPEYMEFPVDYEIRTNPFLPGSGPGFPGAPGFPGGGPGGFPGPPSSFPGGGPGGFPGGGPGGGPGGQQPPSSPPPSFTPQKSQVSTFAVDPGGIRRCLFRNTYIWLNNGSSFWFYPIFVGRTSIAGWRWNRRWGWVYFGINLRSIQSFQCF